MKQLSLITLLFFLFTSLSFAANQDSSLLAFFPFNGNANDSSLYSNDGQLSGDIKLTTDRFGHPNSAYYFNGEDTHIKVSPTNYPINSENFTLSIWIKHKSFIPLKVEHNTVGYSDMQYIIDLHSEGPTYTDNSFTDGPLLVLIDFQSGLSQLRQYIFKNDAVNGEIIPYREDQQFYPDSTQWYHIVFKKQERVVTTYLNNRIVDKTYMSNNISLNLNNYWYIGNCGASIDSDYRPEWNFAFNGAIDDVKLYSKALDEQEITALFEENNFNTSIENNRFVDLKVYPNPTKEFINIDTEEFSLLDDNIITIYNASGLAVYSSKIDTKSLKVDISNLGSQGLYFILIMDKDLNTVSKKLILLK